MALMTTCNVLWSLFHSMTWRPWQMPPSCWNTRTKLRQRTARGRHLPPEDLLHQDLAPLRMRGHQTPSRLLMHLGHIQAMHQGRAIAPLIHQDPAMVVILGVTLEAAQEFTMGVLEETATTTPTASTVHPSLSTPMTQDPLEAVLCAGRKDTSHVSVLPRLLHLHRQLQPR